MVLFDMAECIESLRKRWSTLRYSFFHYSRVSILTKTKVAEILHLATGKQKTQKGCKSHPQICIEFIA